jgi:peptide/nickel transport system permease protein
VLLRILSVIPVLLVASILVFVTMRVIPGDPVSVLTQGAPLTVQQRQALTRQYHLDQPIPVQYVQWLRGALTGDFGRSLSSNRPVTSVIAESLPRTLILLAGGFVFSMAFAIPLGLLAALREGRPLDHLIVGLTMLLFSVPLFISSVIAIYLFAFRWNLLPSFGFGSDGGVGGVFKHLLLPWCALGLSLLAVQTATLRAALVDVFNQEYVRMAESRGLPWLYVLRKHALRSALVPVVTLLGLQLSFMLIGSVFVDYIFGVGGFGTVLVNAVKARDLTVVQTAVMLVSTFFVFSNLAVDLAAARLDPRYAIR